MRGHGRLVLQCHPSFSFLFFSSSFTSNSLNNLSLPLFLSFSPMRKLCPNFDREDGLDTVLEVPIPEEMFSCNTNKAHAISWQAMKTWVKSNHHDKSSHVNSIASLFGGRNAEIQLLLGVVGAPLIPLPIIFHHQPITCNIKDNPIVNKIHFFSNPFSNLNKPINVSLLFFLGFNRRRQWRST